MCPGATHMAAGHVAHYNMFLQGNQNNLKSFKIHIGARVMLV